MITDCLLVMALGFVGSFGHCSTMCGPLVTAFALAQSQASTHHWTRSLGFQILLNLGRLGSYGLIGAGMGSLGSVLIASGHLAGLDSPLRQGITLFTGVFLIGLGLVQIDPKGLPRLPFLHPLAQAQWHQHLNQIMQQLTTRSRWWTPAGLGLIWGLLPCGFLYTAQIKAAATGNAWIGGVTMLAFGLGTLPAMLGLGMSTSLLSTDRRSQLFQLGGWITLTIGCLTLLRTGQMVDYTGHVALIGLMLALVARPISRYCPQLLAYRRLLGVGSCVLAVAHTLHMLNHTFNWDLITVGFLLPSHQISLGFGGLSLLILLTAAATSFDRIMERWRTSWRRIHQLTVPALILAGGHALLIGSHYLGGFQLNWAHYLRSGMLILGIVMVVLVRQRWIGSFFSLETSYGYRQFSRGQADLAKPDQGLESGSESAAGSTRSCH